MAMFASSQEKKKVLVLFISFPVVSNRTKITDLYKKEKNK